MAVGDWHDTLSKFRFLKTATHAKIKNSNVTSSISDVMHKVRRFLQVGNFLFIAFFQTTFST